MYEALELGSIPLIETRRAYPYFEHLLGSHPLPSFKRWSDATAFVERYARDPAELDALQRSCLDWWADFKVGLSRRVREFIASAPQDRQGEAAFHTALPHPIWQVAELARQHSLRRFAAPCGPAAPPRPVRTAFQKLAVTMRAGRACKEPMAKRNHVVFVGVLPPPLHGQSRINEVLVATLRQRADLRVLDTSPRRLERTSLYYVHRIARVLWCLAALAATARPRMPVLSVGQ